MSDDEQMNDNNDEEYEFDYTDSDQSEDNVNIENQYYNRLPAPLAAVPRESKFTSP